MLKAQKKKKPQINSGISVDSHLDSPDRGQFNLSLDSCQHTMPRGRFPSKKGTLQSGVETKRDKNSRIAREHSDEDFDAILAEFMASNIDESAVTAEDNPSFNLDRFQVESPHATFMFLLDLVERINIRVKDAQALTQQLLRRTIQGQNQFDSTGGGSEFAHDSVIADKRKTTDIEYLYQVSAKTLSTQGDFRIIPTVLDLITEHLSRYPEGRLLDSPSKLAEKYKKKYKREIDGANYAMVQDKIRLFSRFDKELDELRGAGILKSLVEWVGDDDDIFMHRLAFYLQNRSAERLAYLVADDRCGQEAKLKIIQLIEKKADKFNRLVLEYRRVMTSSNEPMTQRMEEQRTGNEQALPSMREVYFKSESFKSLLMGTRNILALSTIFSEIRESVILSRTADDRMSYEILINNYEVTKLFEADGELNTMLMTLSGTGLQESALRTYLYKPEGVNESDLLHFRKASKEYFTRMMVKSIEFSANIVDCNETLRRDNYAIILIKNYEKAIQSALMNGIDIRADSALLNDIYIKLKENKKILERKYEDFMVLLDREKTENSANVEKKSEVYRKYIEDLSKVRYLFKDSIVDSVRSDSEQDIGALLDSFINFIRYATPYITANNEGRFIVSHFYTAMDGQIESSVSKLAEYESSNIAFKVNKILSELEAFNSELKKLKVEFSKNGLILSEVIGRVDDYIARLHGHFYWDDTSEVMDKALFPESKKLEKGKAKKGRKYKVLSRYHEEFNSMQSSALAMQGGEGGGLDAVDNDASMTAKNEQSGGQKTKLISENVRKFFFNDVSVYQTLFYEKPDVRLNVGNRWATYDAALELGRDWVGDNYRKNTDGYISADGLRRFRSPKQKSGSTVGASAIQANFEERLSVKNKVFNFNYHLNICNDFRVAKMNNVRLIVT